MLHYVSETISALEDLLNDLVLVARCCSLSKIKEGELDGTLHKVYHNSLGFYSYSFRTPMMVTM